MDYTILYCEMNVFMCWKVNIAKTEKDDLRSSLCSFIFVPRGKGKKKSYSYGFSPPVRLY